MRYLILSDVHANWEALWALQQAERKPDAHAVKADAHLADKVEHTIGYRYQNSVEVLHLLDAIMTKIGLDKISARVTQPLKGLRVACYYGCLYSRPPAITEAEHPEYPMTMDHLMRALEAEPIDWNGKTDCCGGSVVFSQAEPALARQVLEDARARRGCDRRHLPAVRLEPEPGRAPDADQGAGLSNAHLVCHAIDGIGLWAGRKVHAPEKVHC